MLASLASGTGACLGDAKGEYEMLFGEEAKRVEASRGTEDDGAFAAKLLASSGRLNDSPDLRNLVLDKAYQYGIRGPEGLTVAGEALDQMVRYRSKPAGELDALRVELHESRFRLSTGRAKMEAGTAYVELLLRYADAEAARGNAAEADKLYLAALPVAQYVRSPRASEIEAARAREARLAELQTRFKENPTNASARQNLLLHYLLDRNQPEEAAKLVTPDLDETLRTYVPMTVTPVADLLDAACLELGAWFEQLARDASEKRKARALRRAVDYYTQYLAVHDESDSAALRVRRLLTGVETALGEPDTAQSGGLALPWAITVDIGGGARMKMVLIAAHHFEMGSKDEPGRDSDGREGPRHRVLFSQPCYMGVFEVTQEQYEAVMGGNPSVHKGKTRPVENVSWADAVEFCRRLSRKTGRDFRLPTEARWEHACGGGYGRDTRSSFDGDDEALLEYGNYADRDCPGTLVGVRDTRRSDGHALTAPVGSYKPNNAGLYDMYGNVREWCADWYGPYTRDTLRDPKGPESGTHRVVRGGAWNSPPAQCRGAVRDRAAPAETHDDLGFRVVMTISDVQRSLRGFSIGGGWGSGSCLRLTAGNASHVVFILDRSVSMEDGFDIVRRDLVDAIRTLRLGQDFHVILAGGGKLREPATRRLVPATDLNKAAAERFLETVTTGGRGDVAAAFNQAFNVLEQADLRRPGLTICFLARDVPDADAILKTIRTRNGQRPQAYKHVFINTYLFENRSLEIIKIMQTIAKENRGRYRSVDREMVPPPPKGEGRG